MANPMAAFTNDICDPQNLMLNNGEVTLTPPPIFDGLPPRFILGQEVFILDSSGTEPTGLTTYLVLSNHEKDAAGRFLYRLMPSQEIVFRAAETRLLEVKFPLGAQVKRTNDAVCSVVTRRYVVRGRRVYDLKDELERCMKEVKEEELSLSIQGSFAFVTQMQREAERARSNADSPRGGAVHQ